MPRLPAVEVHSLASGSSANCMLVRLNGVNLLLDAGLGIRRLSSHLKSKGLHLADLHAVLVTHEHIDHVCGLEAVLQRSNAMAVATRGTLDACLNREITISSACELPASSSLDIHGVTVQSFRVSHDATDPVGYVIGCDGWQMAYFTDCGCVSIELRNAIRNADLVVAESNHDVEMLRRGPYTEEMKRRVASTTGHLSNAECGVVLAERVGVGKPPVLWLAHLSRVNNSPSLARRTVIDQIRARTDRPFELAVALRDSPSISYRLQPQPVQLSLF